MSIASNREVILRYINSNHSDISMIAEDAVFTIMATGQENRGKEAVTGMLGYFYHVAFDARAITHTLLVDEAHAVVEGSFVGKHIGEFNGIPATGKDVQVPLCIVYDLENNQVKRGRIYFELPALLQQLGVPMG